MCEACRNGLYVPTPVFEELEVTTWGDSEPKFMDGFQIGTKIEYVEKPCEDQRFEGMGLRTFETLTPEQQYRLLKDARVVTDPHSRQVFLPANWREIADPKPAKPEPVREKKHTPPVVRPEPHPYSLESRMETMLIFYCLLAAIAFVVSLAVFTTAVLLMQIAVIRMCIRYLKQEQNQ